ncbi:rolling circle replication-associated protein [Clostridium gasigenes]|uniref:Replication-associated protein ORF2/G2P domain-containing protein n=1 Tax=Clostridium gasigenes TaxID=94869 RepID=A0A1H0M641_9CLOT|nr:hypothetical protein [Clostridium gasigenes]SDO75825.1 hypothetical protein SAMN04488529_101334 [Clostridium gasigenes]
MLYRQKIWKQSKKNTTLKEILENLDIKVYPIDLREKNKSRKNKKKESAPKQKNLNDKRAREYLRRLINCNFDNSDLVLHLTYRQGEEPKDYDDAKKDIANLIARINRYRKKIGLGNLKYIAVIEGGNGTGKKIHHHLVIDGQLDRDTLEKFWKKGYANSDRLQGNETGFGDLANYISKDPKGNKRWTQSVGLAKPEISVNDNKFSGRKMYNMLTNHPSREELEKMYPGYTLTNYKIVLNEENCGVYMDISMRRIIKNKHWKKE